MASSGITSEEGGIGWVGEERVHHSWRDIPGRLAVDVYEMALGAGHVHLAAVMKEVTGW